MSVVRSVYVISDLHIGGIYANAAAHPSRRRGFRMMTHVAELAGFIRHLARLPDDRTIELVINGDFIDFLAEEKNAGLRRANGKPVIDPDEAPEWTPFRWRRGEALAAFNEVVERDKDLFEALRELLAKGKALTLVLGNHDIELCLPDVRAAFEAEVGPGRLRFLDDGQALDLGEVLIDHGNLFDPANVVDHDKLRVIRAAHSRGYFEDLGDAFAPPAGSRLVAEVMNPIKVAYGFIDLLKPESEPLFALLLALEPSYRGVIDDTAKVLLAAAKTLVPRRGMPYRLRNVTDHDDDDAPSGGLKNVAGGGEVDASAIDALISQVLANDPKAAAALSSLAKQEGGAVNVAGGWRPKWSLFRLLIGDDDGDLDSRIPQVQGALRALEGDQSFVRGNENARYLDAAKWLATRGPDQKGYKAVVFGHTHHAKAMSIPDLDASYFNTGTWANLMKFPESFTSPLKSKDEVRDELVKFAKKLQANDLDEYLHFEPTYVRLDFDGESRLVTKKLLDYEWRTDTLPD